MFELNPFKSNFTNINKIAYFLWRNLCSFAHEYVF